MKGLTARHPTELEAFVQCGHRDGSNGEIIVGPPGGQWRRPLLASMACLSLAVVALSTRSRWQHQTISAPEAVLSTQSAQKNDLDDLKKDFFTDYMDDDEGEEDKSDATDPKNGGEKEQKTKSSQKPVAKFGKCGGGVDWPGSTCCQKGCACIIKSMYFSMCQTPKGAKECDPLAAKDEVRRAIIRAKVAPRSIGRLKNLAKKTAASLPALKKMEAKHKRQAAKIEIIGKKMRAKKDAAVKKARQARAKADKIRKEAAASGKELWTTKHENKNLLASQAEASKAYWTVKGKVKSLEKQTEELTAAINVTEKEAVKLEAEAKQIVAKASKVGTLRETLEQQANKSATERKRVEEHATDLVAKVARAEKAVKYEAANVNVWRKAAKGDTCSSLIAEHVHLAPIVDYGGDEVSDEEAERALKKAEEAEKDWKKKKQAY